MQGKDDEIKKATQLFKEKLDNIAQLPGTEIYEIDEINIHEVEAKTQPWLWPGLIPLHTCTLFAGMGGVGKSSLFHQIASYITTGEKFITCGLDFQLSQGQVIILSAEDDVEYQLKPKLIAANANLDYVKILKCVKGKIAKKKHLIDLNEQLDILEQKIKEYGNVKLIIIDPISYFTGNLKDHINTDVCSFIDSLNDLAKKYDLSIILNKHLRKQSGHDSVSNAVNEVAGGGAWINAPRQSWLISPHPKFPDQITITSLKTNISKRNNQCLAFKIIEITLDNNIHTTKIEWCNQLSDLNSNEALNRESYEKSKEQIAIDFILDYLERGQCIQKDVCAAALKENITQRSFERVIGKLKKEGLIISDKVNGLGSSPCIKLTN